MKKWLGLSKSGRRGQSIVILAIAFLALLGFVGIVTDVSLMFVRYAGLRRAVDAAAIAAAGQMRTDRNIANVGLAARQFIEFHGLNPVMVAAETCLIAPGDPQLCPTLANPVERKLVRVTAQVRSDTVFMRLLGFNSIMLEASSVSETAVLDIVIVMDVSESMLDNTLYTEDPDPDYDSYADIGMGYFYRPPTMDEVMARYNQDDVPPNGATDSWSTWTNGWLHFLGRTQVSASTDSRVLALTGRQAFGATIREPREECRIRFFPFGYLRSITTGHQTWSNVLGHLSGMGWPDDPFQAGTQPLNNWYGWVPTYNFYGCCNDPSFGGTVDLQGNITVGTSSNPDWDFSDLICQPFKNARDAVREFLLRIDFTRGDRVAFVTFDRTAFLMDPDGTGTSTHMIDTQATAISALNRFVGVGAEPSHYDWMETSGGWLGFADGVDATDNSVVVDYNSTTNFQLRSYPVWQACDFQNAALFYPLSLTAPQGRPGTALQDMGHPLPSERSSLTINPNVMRDGDLRADFTYEYRARCSGANMGAALREAYNALVEPQTRRETGAVWVVILISDGGVGASDPAYRNGTLLEGGNPYDPNPLLPPLSNPSGTWGTVGDYGAYGLCPYQNIVDGRGFPYCQDTSFSSRHFCINLRDETLEGRIDFNYSSTNPALSCAGNEQFYDVDDYTRDWADFLGMRDPRNPNVVLPTIFTIGFGIGFELGGGDCASNIEDCLGEEMLRYIADVGDNNQIDTDYQQDYLDDFSLNGSLSSVQYGPRGICENNTGTPGVIDPLPEGDSCGNYFNAPNSQELENVFNIIASRMFTRISG